MSLASRVRVLLLLAVVAWERPAPAWAAEAGETSATSVSLAFTADGKGFSFDTGCLRGILRPQGRAVGLASVVDTASGVAISRPPGLFSHYRLLDAETRYGPAAWDWPSQATLRADGSVEAVWTADAAHPFDLKAVYRWTTPDTLDVVTSVTSHKDLTRLESFLASYFDGFDESWVYVQATDDGAARPTFVEATPAEGVWQMFPRDAAAVEIIRDGRWKRPPHPVDWAIRPMLAGPLAMRRDRKTGLVALAMAPPEDCFAVATPYGEESHRSLYLSLFGRDFKRGQTATARARLVIRRDVSFDDAVRIFEEYLKSNGKGGRAGKKTSSVAGKEDPRE